MRMRISRDEWQWRDDEVMLGIISRDILFWFPLYPKRQRQCDAFYCLCIELYLILGFFSPVRPAPAIVSVMSDDHFLCFLLWWWQSGSAVVGPFIPRPVSPPQVYTLQLSEQCVQCTVCTVYSTPVGHLPAVLPPAPPPPAEPSPTPHRLSVWGCGGLGWALRTSKPYLTSSLSRALPPQHTDMLMFFVTVNCD